MGIKIVIEGSEVDDSEIFSTVQGQIDDSEIMIKGSKLRRTKLMTDLNVEEFCRKLNNNTVLMEMPIEEYASLQAVLEKQKNKKSFIDALLQHLISFSEGVIASLVANLFT